MQSSEATELKDIPRHELDAIRFSLNFGDGGEYKPDSWRLIMKFIIEWNRYQKIIIVTTIDNRLKTDVKRSFLLRIFVWTII